ncbi:hypothetical protein POM88_024150 [Heracleum sosnowskyi]|uniref:Uncharacterized protein n=1 Tax=Heracleum sosnowskyi TaxID=360622 RepID=A0AAD8I1U2_9APIA|nr:hypothetical protein POM88_024150 [Heracleum sosnowskyi]
MLDGHVLKWVDPYIRFVAMGTTMMNNLAKFIVFICQTSILSDSEVFLCCDIIGNILSMKLGTYVHMMRACYALQYLSYERFAAINEKAIIILTELSCNRDNTVAVSALGVLGNIARWGTSWQIKIFDSVPHDEPVSKPMKFQWEVCRIISKIADQWPTLAQNAKEQFRNHTRKLVGESISAALHTLKSRTREW